MNIDNLTEEQIEELSGYLCPESYGFEGPETYPSCHRCLICLCKQRREK